MTHVGRYQIVEELGRGAMGVVYKALDPTIGRTVAIKAIRLSEFQDPDERERIHQRLWREARSAGVLSHPNVITIFDLIEQGSAAYIVMECVNGPSLAQLFRRGAVPERLELLAYLRQVANALDYAHHKGVVHRDVKPGNIIISENTIEGRSLAKVADFGVAKFISQETTHSGTMIGTPSYLSPEQIESGASDGRSDQFSLAVVIYELLTGQKPFDSESLSALFYQICKQMPKPADQLNPLLPVAVGKVLMRGLAKEPDQRFATCGELISALESALTIRYDPAPLSEPVVHDLPPIRSRRSRLDEETETVPHETPLRLRMLVGSAALLVCSGTGLYYYRSHSSKAAPPSSNVSDTASGTPARGTESDVEKPNSTTVKVPARVLPPPTQERLLPVTLRTEPVNAKIRIDDQTDSDCVSPCNVELSIGRHTVQASSDGFNVAKRIFNVPQDKELSIVLERSMGLLLLTSEPKGSTVTVDGKPSGETPVTLRLTAGAHQVVLTYGSQRHEESVTVASDEFTSRTMHWQ